MLALSLLPAEHLHESDSGSIVHRHVIDDEGGHPRSIDHGDHHGAKTLEPTFVSESQYDLEQPEIIVTRVLVAPEGRLLDRVEPNDAPVAHGPPIRVGSLRAPPA
jgi:hypothetical protein